PRGRGSVLLKRAHHERIGGEIYYAKEHSNSVVCEVIPHRICSGYSAVQERCEHEPIRGSNDEPKRCGGSERQTVPDDGARQRWVERAPHCLHPTPRCPEYYEG